MQTPFTSSSASPGFADSSSGQPWPPALQCPAFYDVLPSLILVLDRTHQLVFRNRALLDFASRHPLPFLTPAADRLACTAHGSTPPIPAPSSDDACPCCALAKLIDSAFTGRPRTQTLRFTAPDGDVLELRLHAALGPFDPAGDHVVVTAEDITKETRHVLLERLFFHDILNTAGGLHGMAQLIHADPASVAEFRDDLLHTADTLVHELRQQRLLLAAEQEELNLDLQSVSALQLLSDVAHTYRHHPRGADRPIVISARSVDFRLLTDPTLMHRILGNLVKNALEACAPGEIVELGCAHEPGVHLFWCQNPRSIPPEQQRQLFMRNFSTKGAGRGLGTYSVKLLTEHYLGGHVTLHSAPATGTRFELTFPSTLR